MEATKFLTVASRHFSAATSPSLSAHETIPISRSLNRIYPSLVGPNLSTSLSSKNLFTREIWGWVNSKTVISRREMRGIGRAEMFGQLTRGLAAAWKNSKEKVLTKENIVDPMREIKRVLLEADIVNDKLMKLMGGDVSELAFAESGPTVILLAGLQGVGKRTVCAKLAYYLKKQVHIRRHIPPCVLPFVLYVYKQATPAHIRGAEKRLKIMEGMIEAMTPRVSSPLSY